VAGATTRRRDAQATDAMAGAGVGVGGASESKSADGGSKGYDVDSDGLRLVVPPGPVPVALARADWGVEEPLLVRTCRMASESAGNLADEEASMAGAGDALEGTGLEDFYGDWGAPRGELSARGQGTAAAEAATGGGSRELTGAGSVT